MEDAFIVLFFTLITQQLQCLRNKPRNHAHRADKEEQETEHSGHCSTFPWLQVDIPSEEARDFFPTDVVKSVTPSPGNPAHLKLSVVLEAFQQFLRAFENLKQDNRLLQWKGGMYDEMARKCSTLESQMHQAALYAPTHPQAALYAPTHPQAAPTHPQAALYAPTHPQMSGQGASSHDTAATRERIADLEEQVMQGGAFQQAYVRSEERCRQLVEVTQQWALECDEKVNMIKLLEKEAEEVKVTVQRLDTRVGKYKTYWMETKDAPRAGRVSDAQFEELRTELAMRRELYDQVLSQREEALQKIPVLVSEIDSLKDHNVQLMDRAANFKVQAQAKEPSVREMSHLLELKGRLEREVEKLKRNNAELSDKAVALEILVEDWTSKMNHSQGISHSRRADVMVTGYKPLSPFASNPSPTHIKPPHGSQFLAPPTNSSHYHHHKPTATPTTDEDDILSLESSDVGSGNFSSHDSTSEKKPPFTRSNSGHSNPLNPIPQLKSRDASSNPELQSCDIPPGSHDVLPGSHDLEVAPPPWGGNDYTSKIRYPNNSRILVQPLLDEDISLKGDSSGELKTPGVRGASKEPYYCDRSHFNYQQQKRQVGAAPPPNQPTAILSPHSPFFAATTTERKCPVCQHTFLTLSETEFEAHVAVCFR